MKRILLTISLIAGIIAAYTSCEEQEQAPEIVKVESVSINQEDMTLTEGESVTLTATILPEDAADKTVAWSSSSDKIVVIASNGKAKAIAAGEAIITAKSGDKSDFITITVVANSIPVTGLSLSPSAITILVGETQTITAEVTPQDATDKTITWESSNPEVASVDNGLVVGLYPGSATVSAKTVKGSKTAECTVTVRANSASSVTLKADCISAIGGTLYGCINPDNNNGYFEYGFMYSTTAAAMVANPIIVKASNLDSNSSYYVEVSSLSPLTTYYYRSFLFKDGDISYGQTKEFTTKDLSSLLETFDATGVEASKAVLNGKLELTNINYNSLSYGFYYGTSETDMNCFFRGSIISDNASYSASLNDLLHKTQYWYKAFVQLDDQALYGEVKSFTTDVIPVTSIALDRSDHIFHFIGDEISLSAIVTPSDATDMSVEWSSDNTNVATVNSSGRVTAKGNGGAIITATTGDQGKTATCTITVSQYVTGITLDKSSLSLHLCEDEALFVDTLHVTDVLPSNAFDKTYSWSSSDESVVTVDVNGKVVALSDGVAQIRATANDGSEIYAACDITVTQYVTEIRLDKSSLTLNPAENGTLKVTDVLPSNAFDKTYSWSSSDESVVTVYSDGKFVALSDGKALIRAIANDGSGVYATCQVTVIPKGAIDLGLSVYWATCNLGACAPDEYGDYFAFGETMPKSEYTEKNYAFYNPDSTEYTKYNSRDGKTVLDPENDAAHVRLGGNWRMPTETECAELLNRCTWTFIKTNNGRRGYKVTGPNGNSIILPEAGHRYNTTLTKDGSEGSYWSSTKAKIMWFGDRQYVTGGYRTDGYPVRPVTK